MFRFFLIITFKSVPFQNIRDDQYNYIWLFLRSKMERFIRNKLSEKLKSYVDLEGTSLQGLSMTNVAIKPKLMQEISQALSIPLILNSGTIGLIKLKTPWDNIFSRGKGDPEPLIIEVHGLKISARLPHEMQRVYIYAKKQKLIEAFMQKFDSKKESQFTFLNKLKEYFFGYISIEFKDIQFEISVQMRHAITISLKVQAVNFVKESKTETSKLHIDGLSVGYRTAKETKNEYIIKQAALEYESRKIKVPKEQKVQQHDLEEVNKLLVKKLEIELSNQNFNDVRRIIELVKWHNSFVDLPEQIWEFKPNIIGNVNSLKKFLYISKIIHYKARDNLTMKHVMEKRRKYIQIFEKYRRDPTSVKVKDQLEQLESRMDVWRVQEYRNYCILRAKNKSHIEKTVKHIYALMLHKLKNSSQKKQADSEEEQIEEELLDRINRTASETPFRLKKKDHHFHRSLPSDTSQFLQNKYKAVNQMILKNILSNFSVEADSDQAKRPDQQSVGWLRSWFKTKQEKKLLYELQDRLDEEEKEKQSQILRDQFLFNLEEVKIRISIHSHSAKERFLNIISTNNRFSSIKVPFQCFQAKQSIDQENKTHSLQKQQNQLKKVIKTFSIERLMVQYDKYMGHNKAHQHMMHQINQRQVSEEEDQFEDIQNFLEYSSSNTPVIPFIEGKPRFQKKAEMNILPILINFNQEIIQKFKVFKFERIHNNFQQAEQRVLEENILKIEDESNKQKSLNSLFVLKMCVFVKIPESMYEKECPALWIAFNELKHVDQNGRKQFSLRKTEIKGLINVPEDKSMTSSPLKQQSRTQNKESGFTEINILSIALVTFVKQGAESIDKYHINVSPVLLSFKQIEHLLVMISFISKLIPKKKEKRSNISKLRYLRRKQSIGEQFIDACENLNEHIIRSTVLSERTKQQKYIVKEKKDVNFIINLEEIRVDIEDDFIQLCFFKFSLYEFHDTKMLVSEEEEKKVTVRLRDLRKSVKNMKQIMQRVSRDVLSKNSVAQKTSENNSQPLQNKLKNFGESEGVEGQQMGIKLSGLDFELIMEESGKDKLFANFSHFEVERSATNSGSITVRLNCEMGYYTDLPKPLRSHSSSNKKKEHKEPLIQKFNILYQHEKSFNKDQKTLKFSQFKINIKTVLLSELRSLILQLNTPINKIYKMVNMTKTPIQVRTQEISQYKEYGYLGQVLTGSDSCDVIVHGCKQSFSLNRRAGLEGYDVSGGKEEICIMKTVASEYQYRVESNFRVTNYQESTIHIRVLQKHEEKRHESMRKRRRRSLDQESNRISKLLDTATVNLHLQSAEKQEIEERIRVAFSQGQQEGDTTNNARRSSSLIKNKFQSPKASSKYGLFSKNRGGTQMVQHPGSLYDADDNSFQAHHDSMFQSHQQQQNSSATSEKLDAPFSKICYTPKNELSSKKEKKQQQCEVLCLPIKPLQTVQILLNSQEQYIEILEKNENIEGNQEKDITKFKNKSSSQSSDEEQNKKYKMFKIQKDGVKERYEMFKVRDVIRHNQQQILLHSYQEDNRSKESQEQGIYFRDRKNDRQVSQSLVVRTRIQTVNTNSIQHGSIDVYNISIMSPVVVVNKLPYNLKYKYNKEEVDVLETIRVAGKQIRKRSMEAIPMESVSPLQISRHREVIYGNISEMEVCVGDFFTMFNLGSIIEGIKQAHDENIHKQKRKDSGQESLEGEGPKDLLTGLENHNQAQSLDISKTEHEGYQPLPTFTNFLCLNSLNHENSLQMMLQLKLTKHTMKICIYPQYIFLNMTPIPINFQICEENYTYPSLMLPARDQELFYKEYLKMDDRKLMEQNVVKGLYKEYQQNLGIFSGSLDQNAVRKVIYGNGSENASCNIFDDQTNGKRKVVLYGAKKLQIVARKLADEQKRMWALSKTNLVVFMPSLLLINKSDWTFFVKGESQKLKKLEKHSIEYTMISSMVAVQACEQSEQIAYNEWMKISLDTLGIIYYAKEMNTSSGYESREYELRKKRLKKAPKIFFRIVMTKFEYGYQLLIEESQYPPVSFINKCTSRIQIREQSENMHQEMETNETAEYASKIPHYCPIFKLAIVDNYEFKVLGSFPIDLQGSSRGKTLLFQNRVKMRIEEYKDKKIVILEDILATDYKDSRQLKSSMAGQPQVPFLLQMVMLLNIKIDQIEISMLTNKNKELSCFCITQLEVTHQRKHTKRYIKAKFLNMQCYGYNATQPSCLFYRTNAILAANQSQKPTNNSNLLTHSSLLHKTTTSGKMQSSSNSSDSQKMKKSLWEYLPFFSKSKIQKKSALNGRKSPLSNPAGENIKEQTHDPDANAICCIDIVVDYHKHATILQKCSIAVAPLTIVIDANIIIDYIKYYYPQIMELVEALTNLSTANSPVVQTPKSKSQTVIDQTETSMSTTSKQMRKYSRKDRDQHSHSPQKIKKRSSFSSAELSRLQYAGNGHHHIGRHHRKDQIKQPESQSTLHQPFIIENFQWEGSQITIKCQNLNNLSLFFQEESILMNYLFKFITWTGDLRPITLYSSHIEYEQFTLRKIINMVDYKNLGKQFMQVFLHYPLEELYHFLFMTTKLTGFNDLDDVEGGLEQLRTLSKILKAGYRLAKILIFHPHITSSTAELASGDMQRYRRQFMSEARERYSLKSDLEKSQQNFISEVVNRILSFKYCEWNYSSSSITKNQTSFTQNGINKRRLVSQRYFDSRDVVEEKNRNLRLERYSSNEGLAPYDWIYARIKLAIDSHCGNKIYRQINYALLISDSYLLGMTDQWFVLYYLPKEEWAVVTPEKVVSLTLTTMKIRRTTCRNLKIVVFLKMSEEIGENKNSGLSSMNQQNKMMEEGEYKDERKEHLRTYNLENPLIEEETVRTINQQINKMKLAAYY